MRKSELSRFENSILSIIKVATMYAIWKHCVHFPPVDVEGGECLLRDSSTMT